jgi:aerobic carbon-monoxide dehydrogenase large subunit
MTPELQIQLDLSARFGDSRSQKRLEDDRLLVGRGLYSDDRVLPRQAWMVLLRSPHAHARIRNIDFSKTGKILAAWCMADLRADGVGHIPFPALFKRADGSPMAAPLRTPLAEGKVLYVGQPVAAVLAETRAQAQDAVELVEVDYEPLDCVVDARRAIEPGAPQLCESGNIAAETMYGDRQKTAQAFASAKHVVEVELHNQRLNAVALEPRCAIGVHEGGRTTLYTQCQTPTQARDLLGAVFAAEPAAFRVVNGDIGGGFGMKTGLTPEDALVCYAAKKLGRPVKWRADRSEEFLAAHMARDQHYRAALALDAEGRITALRLESLANIGAVPVGSSAMIPLAMVAKVVTSVYRVPVVDYRFKAVLTNTMATGAYRGAGRPEGNFLMERLVEKAARVTGIDRIELRRRNLLRPDELPRRTPVGEVYDSGHFERMLDQVLRAADYAGFAKRKEESRARGKLRGIGVSAYLEWTGALATETVDIEIDASGKVTVFSGTQAMGQGLETTYTQLVMEVFGADAKQVVIVQGDTDRVNGVGSVGSRSAFVGGSAVVAAGRKMILRCMALGAEALEASAADLEVSNQKVSIAGTDRAIAFRELAARQPGKVIRVSATEAPSTPSWPNGAQVCEVEVDADTGEVMLASVTTFDDIGRIINHPIVAGQIHGGVAQGAAQALWEAVTYDAESGQLLTGSLMDYCAPRADQLPRIAVNFDESIPCKTNLLGVKGCGELGTVGAVPAVVHAVLDALHDRGVTHLEMPLTPEKVWRALAQG